MGANSESSAMPSSEWYGVIEIFMKGLILAQNERWRRGLGMQVARMLFGVEAAKGAVRHGYLPSGWA